MKTILFFIPGADGGGIASAFVTLAEVLENCGWRLRVLLPYEADMKRCAIPMHYVVGYAKKREERNPWKIRIFRLLHCLTNYKFYFVDVPKIEHDIFVVYQAASFSFWRNYTKKPTFGWFHGEAPKVVQRSFQQFWKIFERRDYQKFNTLFAVGENIARQWMVYYDGRINVNVLLNLIDVEQIQQAILQKKEESLLGEKRCCKLLYVGRLTQEKGVFRLLEVCQRLSADAYKFELFLLGDGPLRGQLEDFVKQNKLSLQIHFLGWQEKPYVYMNNADLLILPSYTEGFGLVVWEALLAGCHVLATASNGTCEALCDGKYGLLCENSTEGLYQGVKVFLDDDIGYKQRFDLDEIQSEIVSRIECTKKHVKICFG